MRKIEVYGFIFWLLTYLFISTFEYIVLYIIFALIPLDQFEIMNSKYLPKKIYVIIFPCMLFMTLLHVFLCLQSYNMIHTISLSSLHQLQGTPLIKDTFSKYETVQDRKFGESLSDVYDIPINVINNILYCKEDVVKKYNLNWFIIKTFNNKLYIILDISRRVTLHLLPISLTNITILTPSKVYVLTLTTLPVLGVVRTPTLFLFIPLRDYSLNTLILFRLLATIAIIPITEI